MIDLVAFFGNHGKEYSGNRHNAGWMFAEALPFYDSLGWQRKFKGRCASLEMARSPDSGKGDRVHFLMPETYMNLSGDSVGEAAAFFKIPPERILVVHDELELPLGTVGFKFSGGLGGHNGLRSMKARFGTADFWRRRIGIGRPAHADISAWVLSDFTGDEAIMLSQVLPQTVEAFIKGMAEGLETLLPAWSKKKVA